MLQWRRLLIPAGVFALVMLVLGPLVLTAPATVTIDGYYHIKVAQWLAREGPFVDIRWLPLTVLGEHGPDHHWLWHVLLVPFTWFGDLFDGLRWGLVVTAAAVPAALTAIAMALRIPWPPLMALLACTGALIMPGRLLMLRAQNLALVLMVLALFAMARKKPVLLFAVAFAFMLSYHGAMILVPFTALHLGVVAVTERRFDYRAPLAVAAGLLAGLMVTPWFPANLDYLFFHTLYKTSNPNAVVVGSEWLVPGLPHILREAWPAHLTLLAGLVALAWRRTRPSAEALLWLLTAATTFALYTRAWRFAEYYAPLAVLAGGVCLRDAFATAPARPALRRALVAVMALVVLVEGGLGLAVARARSEFVPSKYAAIADALRQRARPDDIAFNTTWEDFVFLFWNDAGTRYVNGLDPNYLAFADPARFGMWLWITGVSADEPNDPAPVIRDVFGARFAVVARGYPGLARRLSRSPHAHLILHTGWGWLYELSPG
ncbi:MAG: hypothetical protein H6744_18095 [Deltaproteobacteria bacterium]|nr:hypothetical protein [Deltaproteobacteria bacterium]MCB9788593.1 hypothetical protein [Deltaproteobacteria bacterium]